MAAGAHRVRYLLQIVIEGALGKFHHGVFDEVGIRDLAENKMILFAGGLNGHVAKIKHGREDTFDGGGDVLDAGKIEFADVPYKQPFLFDVDDALIGDDPDIEVVIDPQEETENPDKDEEGVLNKEEEARIGGSQHFRKQERHH